MALSPCASTAQSVAAKLASSTKPSVWRLRETFAEHNANPHEGTLSDARKIVRVETLFYLK